MSNDDLFIYHNPRCSKSRDALALIRDAGCTPQVIEYLKTPPTVAQFKAVLRKLGMKPEELVRKGEPIYKEHYAGKTLSDDEWIAAMVANPILIERPILVKGDQAVVGRPLKRVSELLRSVARSLPPDPYPLDITASANYPDGLATKMLLDRQGYRTGDIHGSITCRCARCYRTIQ